MRAACIIMLVLCGSTAHAGVALLETPNKSSQWVVAASPARLQALINEWTASVSYLGPVRVRIRCEDTGWVASYYDRDTKHYGVACGFASRSEAEQSALEECQKSGGISCHRVGIGFDDGSWTDSKPGGGIYHLKGWSD